MEFYRYFDLALDSREVKILGSIYVLVKETPCGYWIREKGFMPGEISFSLEDDKRWISKTSHKRYAWPTRKEAIESFILRKRQQIRYTQMRLIRAEDAYTKGIFLKEEMKEKNYEY